MKKIGILFGQDSTFPQAIVDRVNEKADKNITAEFVRIDKVLQGEPLDYAVIIDRASLDVPFYQATLKNAALSGTAVINNPFYTVGNEKFFNNALAVTLGIPVPKTVLLPSKELPAGTTDQSFQNLAYPLNWDAIFEYVGFPAYLKPVDGSNWDSVYQIADQEDLWSKFEGTGQQVMMLQEAITFDEYFRCYCIGGKHVRIMQYNQGNQQLGQPGTSAAAKKLLKTIEEYTLKINQYIGYDFNTVEFAVRDGIPYAIDFSNPVAEVDAELLGQENFDWVVDTLATYAIDCAKKQKDGIDNLTWGEYIKAAVGKTPLVSTPVKAKAPAAKADVSIGVIDHPISEEAQPEPAVAEKPKKAKAAPKAKAKATEQPAVAEPAVAAPVAEAQPAKAKAKKPAAKKKA
uniref:ATP-grasp domain-containing protein n=1 Tax=Mucilaginibacter sp. Bleaf8 TaxID=2834430 RepID=UPI0020C1737D|nr:hypothetical protein [Mucilaginibacter sp. Bleaf8]